MKRKFDLKVHLSIRLVLFIMAISCWMTGRAAMDASKFIKEQIDYLKVSDSPGEGYYLISEDPIRYPYGPNANKRDGIMKTYNNDKGELKSLLKVDDENYIWFRPVTRNNPITGALEIEPGLPKTGFISFRNNYGKYVIVYRNGWMMLINTKGFIYSIIVDVFEGSKSVYSEDLYSWWSGEKHNLASGYVDNFVFRTFSEQISSYSSTLEELTDIKNQVEALNKKIEQGEAELKKLEKQQKKAGGFLGKLTEFNNKLSAYANSKSSYNPQRPYNNSRPASKSKIEDQIKAQKQNLEKYKSEVAKLSERFNAGQDKLNIYFNTIYGQFGFDPQKGFAATLGDKALIYDFTKYGPVVKLFVEPDYFIALSTEDQITSISQEGNIITVDLAGGDYVKYSKYSHKPFEGKLTRKDGYFTYETSSDGSETTLYYIFGTPYTVEYTTDSGRRGGNCEVPAGSKMSFSTLAREVYKLNMLISTYDPTDVVLKDGLITASIYDNVNGKDRTHFVRESDGSGATVYWEKSKEIEKQQEAQFQASADAVVASYKAKYGASVIDNIMKGQITVGMPWSLVSEVFPNGLFDSSAYSKVYKVVNNIPQVIVATKKLQKQEYGMGKLVYVTVRNGKVTHVTYTSVR